MDVDGGNTNSHSLMGFTNGETYTIMIVSKISSGLLSRPVEAGTVSLCKSKCLHTSILHAVAVCALGVCFVFVC